MGPSSHARVIWFLDDENGSGNEDEEDEDEDREEKQERAGSKKDSNTEQLKLKAPNFTLLSSDEDDSVQVNPYKSPASLSPAAELEAEWSTPECPIPQWTTPLSSQMNIDVIGKTESSQSPSLFMGCQKALRCMNIYSVICSVLGCVWFRGIWLKD